jgi:hypothetical protein
VHSLNCKSKHADAQDDTKDEDQDARSLILNVNTLNCKGNGSRRSFRFAVQIQYGYFGRALEVYMSLFSVQTLIFV